MLSFVEHPADFLDASGVAPIELPSVLGIWQRTVLQVIDAFIKREQFVRKAEGKTESRA